MLHGRNKEMKKITINNVVWKKKCGACSDNIRIYWNTIPMQYSKNAEK